MVNKLNRRDFLASTAVGVTAACSQAADVPEAEATKIVAPLIPRRVLGQTGEEVSILGFGGGSRFGRYEDEEAIAIVNQAIDSGINYFDTAMRYGEGSSQRRYGEVMKTRRKEVFLTTKVPYRNYDEALTEMDKSLKDLQTDHVDLLHIHSLEGKEDLAELEKPDGLLKAVYRLREEGMARFIGVTSHSDAETMKMALQRHDFNCCMMALNAATNTPRATGFERIALPVAKEKNLGILAMKVAGQDRIVGDGVGKASIKDLLYYSLSLPVAACVIGMPTLEMVRNNIQLAQEFRPMTDPQMQAVRDKVEPSAVAFNRFLLHHNDDCYV